MSVAPLPLAVRHPLRAVLLAHRHEAHQTLGRLATRDVAGLTRIRARNRLRRLRAFLAFLKRTDHAADAGDGIPSREERERQIKPMLAHLERLARRERPARRARESPPTKETPMATHHCIVEGHPHHASGCIVDDPHAKPPAPPSNGAAAPGFPPALMPTLLATEGVYAVPNPDQVRRQRALDLARLALDYPEGVRVELVGRLLYRVLMRTVRGGAA